MVVVLFRIISVVLAYIMMMVVMVMLCPSDARHDEALTSSELVNKVCSQTSNYSFCAEALYSNHLTPGAEDYYTLACVSFNLAALNSTNTEHYISQLLEEGNSTTPTFPDRELLRRCDEDYKKAISILGQANGDLVSETFDSLFDYAAKASSAADDCQALFSETSSPLTVMNGYLKGLSKICSVVSKLVNGH